MKPCCILHLLSLFCARLATRWILLLLLLNCTKFSATAFAFIKLSMAPIFGVIYQFFYTEWGLHFAGILLLLFLQRAWPTPYIIFLLQFLYCLWLLLCWRTFLLRLHCIRLLLCGYFATPVVTFHVFCMSQNHVFAVFTFHVAHNLKYPILYISI